MLSHNDDIALIDLEQQFWPYFFPRSWQCFALWVHVILTLEDGKDGQGASLSPHAMRACAVALHTLCGSVLSSSDMMSHSWLPTPDFKV